MSCCGRRPKTSLRGSRRKLNGYIHNDLEPLVPGEYRLGDTRHTISDISRLQALGWEPTIPVEQNVAEYVAWMKEQQGTAEYLEEAERVMRAQGVVRVADSGWQTCPEPKP